MEGEGCEFGVYSLELGVVLCLDEFAELAYDDRDVFGSEIFSQCGNHFGEAETVGDGSFFVVCVGFALVPEDSSQAGVGAGGGEGGFGSLDGICVMRAAGDPFVECGATEGGRDQTNGGGRFHADECGGEVATEADAGAVWPVKVDWVDSGDPGFFFAEGEDVGGGEAVCIRDEAAPGHVGLANEQEDVYRLGVCHPASQYDPGKL